MVHNWICIIFFTCENRNHAAFSPFKKKKEYIEIVERALWLKRVI